MKELVNDYVGTNCPYSQHPPQTFRHAGLSAALEQLLGLADTILGNNRAVLEVSSRCADSGETCWVYALQAQITRSLAQVLVQASRDPGDCGLEGREIHAGALAVPAAAIAPESC